MSAEPLFEISPGENPWEVLPEETICEVILRIRDFKDLLRYMNVSQRFRKIAQTCVTSIDSPELIEVEIELLINFSGLQTIGDNIHVVVKPETVPLLSTLPNLRKADIRLDWAEIQFELSSVLEGTYHLYPFLRVLPQLNLERKIPLVNFRVTDKGIFLYIQGNRYMVLPTQKLLDQNLQKDYSYLERVYIPSIYDDPQRRNPGLRLMTRSLRAFISEGDFGLTDPTQPPSEVNPPLSVHLLRLANSGLAKDVNIDNIFNIYLRYHKLLKISLFPDALMTLFPDALMTKYLRKFHDQASEAKIARKMFHYQWDRLNFASLTELIYIMRYNGRNRDFFEFDIPTPLQDYDQISQILEGVLRTYRTPRITFYRTDGSTFTSSGR